MAPDDRFKAYLSALQNNFRVSTVQGFIHMILTCMSMPQVINQYRFLMQVTKQEVQSIYEHPNLTKRLLATNELFSNFAQKLELWAKLEQNYDFK